MRAELCSLTEQCRTQQNLLAIKADAALLKPAYQLLLHRHGTRTMTSLQLWHPWL